MLEFSPFSTEQILPFVAAALLLYSIYGVVYRLYLSPIAGFPGPKLAALTLWYEFYYDVFPLSGQYIFHVGELHKKYGPIIRINPYELHVSTPQFYQTLYSSTKKRNKWYYSARMLGIDLSGFGTLDHNLHRIRRAAANPYFSAASVRRLQPVIEGKVKECLERLKGLEKTGEVARAVVVTSAFATVLSIESLTAFVTLWIVRSLPNFVVRRLGRSLAGFATLTQEFIKQIRETISEKDEREGLGHKTIFHELLKSDLPPEEKTVERLADDAQAFVTAAGERVSFALTVAIYHLLANPQLLNKLKTELKEAISDPDDEIPLITLEKLPYLTGVIKEGLRLSYGVSSRLPRIAWEPLVFATEDREWIIPAGTPVGMTSLLLHHDESIYPNSREFKPERWIEDPHLDRYMVAFSKGSRQCIGMNLAYTEMYLWLFHVFRRFGSKEVRFEDDEGIIELVDTDISDVEVVSDHLVPDIRDGSHGVLIRFSK